MLLGRVYEFEELELLEELFRFLVTALVTSDCVRPSTALLDDTGARPVIAEVPDETDLDDPVTALEEALTDLEVPATALEEPATALEEPETLSEGDAARDTPLLEASLLSVVRRTPSVRLLSHEEFIRLFGTYVLYAYTGPYQ